MIAVGNLVVGVVLGAIYIGYRLRFSFSFFLVGIGPTVMRKLQKSFAVGPVLAFCGGVKRKEVERELCFLEIESV